MNAKLICTGALALMVGITTADAGTNKFNYAQLQAARIQRQGGLLAKPTSGKGRIVIVNAQSRLPEAELETVAGMFRAATQSKVVVAKDGTGAEIVLTVIDDSKEPQILVAPDDRWGKVNLAKLTDDLPAETAKAKFFAPRARKLVIKALSLVCGGGSSNYPSNPMNTATARELDMSEEQIPYDVAERMKKYLPKVDVTKIETATYRKACKEGWAPQPTNEVQKKIWNEVFTMPDKPIKIQKKKADK